MTGTGHAEDTLQQAYATLAVIRAARTATKGRGTTMASWTAIPDPPGVPFGAAMRVNNGQKTGTIRSWMTTNEALSADDPPGPIQGVLISWDGAGTDAEIVHSRDLNRLRVVF